MAHNRSFLVGDHGDIGPHRYVHRRGYQLHVLHEYRMDSASVHNTIDYLAKEDWRRAARGMWCFRKSDGAGSLWAGGFASPVKGIKPADIAISSHNIREGMLCEVMPDDMRADPPAAPVGLSKKKDASTGFGDRLYEFVTPLFADAEEGFNASFAPPACCKGCSLARSSRFSRKSVFLKR